MKSIHEYTFFICIDTFILFCVIYAKLRLLCYIDRLCNVWSKKSGIEVSKKLVYWNSFFINILCLLFKIGDQRYTMPGQLIFYETLCKIEGKVSIWQTINYFEENVCTSYVRYFKIHVIFVSLLLWNKLSRKGNIRGDGSIAIKLCVSWDIFHELLPSRNLCQFDSDYLHIMTFCIALVNISNSILFNPTASSSYCTIDSRIMS